MVDTTKSDMTKNIVSPRNQTFDVMKGIAMMAVIVGHIAAIPYMPLRHLIFTFHMPLFFLLGGYFFKPSNDFKGRALKDSRRLLIPYAFTSAILIVHSLMVDFIAGGDLRLLLRTGFGALYGSGGQHSSPLWGDLPWVGAIWFLMALFWCRSVYNFIDVKINGLLKYGLIIGLALLAILIDKYVVNLPFAILPGLSAMVFYMIGNLCKRFTPPGWLVVVCLACWPVGFWLSHLYMVTCSYGLYPVDVLGACGGTITVYGLSKLACRTIAGGYLAWVGRMSIVFLCFHLILLNTQIISWCGIPNTWWALTGFHIIFCTLAAISCTRIGMMRQVFGI